MTMRLWPLVVPFLAAAAHASTVEVTTFESSALPPPWSLGTVVRTDASTWWLVDSPFVQRLRDGQSEEVLTFTDARLTTAFFVSSHEGWVVGEKGTILHTRDDGATWQAEMAPTVADLTRIFCADADHCWAFGGDIELRTADGGHLWEAVPTEGDCAVTAVHFLDAQRGFVTCGSALLRTSDGGRTWTAVPLALDDESELTAVQFANDIVGWIASAHAVARTEDGGLHWEVTLRDDEVEFFGLVSPDGWTVFAAGRGFGIDSGNYRSFDGGRTWEVLRGADEEPEDWEAHLHEVAPPAEALRLGVVSPPGPRACVFQDALQVDIVDWRRGAGRSAATTRIRLTHPMAICSPAQALAEVGTTRPWPLGADFDPCQLDPAAVDAVLGKVGEDTGVHRTLQARCGAITKTFHVPSIITRRMLRRRAPSALKLADLAESLGPAPWPSPEHEASRSLVDSLAQGAFDDLFDDPARVREAIVAYRPGAPVAALRGAVAFPGAISPRFKAFHEPIYPSIARSARVIGRVGLDLDVDAATGVVLRVSVAYGVPLLDQEAIVAARRWVFEPSEDLRKPLHAVVTYEPCAGQH
jgi:TonB family protein